MTGVYYHVLPMTGVYYHVLPMTGMYSHVLPMTGVYYHVLPCTLPMLAVRPCAIYTFRRLSNLCVRVCEPVFWCVFTFQPFMHIDQANRINVQPFFAFSRQSALFCFVVCNQIQSLQQMSRYHTVVGCTEVSTLSWAANFSTFFVFSSSVTALWGYPL